MATNPIDPANEAQPSGSMPGEADSIGPGVSPKHRAILEVALAQVSNRSFNEFLASMPDVGLDTDFTPSRE